MPSIGDARLTRRIGRWGLLCLVVLSFAVLPANALAADTVDPTVTIEQPTTDPTYVTSGSTVDLGGSASDDVGVTSVTWANAATSDTGTATGTDTRSISSIPLNAGDTAITVSSNATVVTIALDGTGTQTTFPRSDTPLAGGYLIDGPVNAVAFDSAGRAYIGGAFSSIGQRSGRGVHLTTSSDQPDPAFPDVDGPINAVAPYGSGGWFIGGSFANVGGTPRANVAHILPSGSLDPAWNPG